VLGKRNREELVLKNLVKVLSLWVLSVATVNATYVYEANQPLYDLQTNSSGSTGLGSNDDAVSAAFDLGFTFTFYGNDFTQARMATNGCLHFNLTGSYCGDFTPDPLPQYTNTLFVFWTDLIKDGGSAMKAKAFDDYTIFGWYNMREYNRANSDNSVEVWLYPNNTFEYRYGGLDIINHDVLIGEQGSESETYTYLFHDECGVGSTNITGTCVNTDWNNTSFNTLLENGGSLYGLGTGNALDCSSPLNNTACSGYDAAYLTQQCGIDSLYNLSCPYYWDAYDDQQCDLDPQYGPFCAGYTQEESVAYYAEDEFDYGYTQDDMWYDEEYDEWLDPNDPCYENRCEGFTDEDWYELDVEQFGQEQVDEWFGEEVEFSEEGYLDFSDMATTEEEFFTLVDEGMDEYDIEQEAIWAAEELVWQEEQRIYEEEVYLETYEETYEEVYEEIYLFEPELEQEYDVLTSEEDLMFNFEHEQLVEVFEEEPIEFLEFETIEELEEYFEEDEFTEDEVVEELVVEEMDEDSDLEDNESLREEREDSEEESEVSLVESDDSKDGKKERQLNVVANTIRSASNSVSGTTSGTSIQSTGNSVASGGVSSTTSTAVASSASGGGISTSNSPSISAQVASSAIQTQQVLSMSTGSVGVSSVSVDTSSTSGASGSMETSSVVASADNTAIDNTAGDNNTAVGNTDSGSNVAVGSDTTDTSETTDNSSVASNTSGDNNTAIGNTSGDNNVAVGNTDSGSNTPVGSMETEIATAMGEVSASEADQVADQIVAQNIQDQQEQLEEQQQETGEYADEAQLIAYMGYVQGFDDYRQVALADASTWYEPEAIYANVSMSDNNAAFIGLYGDSLTGMRNLMRDQPRL